MVRGYEQHQERLAALGRLGRPLARRSGSACELCGATGQKLLTIEVSPLSEEPELERSLFVCQECSDGLDSVAKGPAQRWRCLENTMWSEVPAVQVTAVRVLRALADSGEGWARDLLEDLYLAPEIETWIEQT